MLVWALAVVVGGCVGHGSSSTSTENPPPTSAQNPSSFPPAEYQSAPPPRPELGGDDENYNPLSVDDTGIAAVAGDRLYYLSADRGLVAFDVTQVDAPAVLGGSSLSGVPQALYVEGNLLVAVFGGWFGTTSQHQPFQGSVVRVLDATDPAHIALVGEVPIDGNVQKSRIVGNVLYTAGTARPASGTTGIGASPQVVVASVGWTGTPHLIDEQRIPGDDGVFAFAANALLASAVVTGANQAATTLQYVDLSDPAGAVRLRGSVSVPGQVGFSGYCANAGGWDVDFADGLHAHAVVESAGNVPLGAELATVDFTNPDAPVLSVLPEGVCGAAAVTAP